MKKSWKTSLAGLSTIIIAAIPAILSLINGQQLTDTEKMTIGALVAAGVQGLVARDNNVTSEDAGAKPKA
jgi:hypothetical protein